MDMIYHLPFRDWLELNTKLPAGTIAAADTEPENGGSGDRT
jgi:beta-lactamase class C